ncbi:MAG TPA: hypothetical protein VK762_27950 [Polyangiaceae bacterium]|jgi:hypothetical protein|nr:hypothetical protein [Polyangiaceae bacterium]
MPRRNSQAALRFAERRRREDEAQKLCQQVPDLASLEIVIEERSGAGGTKHIRRFMVDHAPALFLVACGDLRCTEGEHDLTHEIMRALRARQTSFRGSDACAGSIGPSSCLRVIHFEGTARYRPVPIGIAVAASQGPLPVSR